MIEMWSVSVRKDGSISFTLSSRSSRFLLSYLENHCNLISFEKEDLGPPPPSMTIWILIHTFQTSVEFFCSDICPCCVSLLDLSSVCVSIIFFCLWLLALGDHVCGACVYFTVRGRRGSPPTWGMLWKCHCLVVLCFMTQFIQQWWFFCSPQRGLLLCLPGIRNGK